MPDLLNLGSSALLSLQRAISTTGHNISNVNTEGYSRQRVNFVTQPPEFSGGAYLGRGAALDSVERFYDQYLTAEVRDKTSSQSRFQTFYDLSNRLEGLLADPGAGLNSTLESFFGALQDVANNPASLPERQVLLGEAQVLADRFHYLDSNFRNLDAEIDGRIQDSVAEINSLADSIASLNKQVSQSYMAGQGQPPNDLLDSRDQLVRELAQRIDVNVVDANDGTFNLMIGNGQALVVGGTFQPLEVRPNPLGGTRPVVALGNTGAATNLERFLKGGELGGLLDFREQVLDPALNQLGLVATGVTAVVNEQHSLGMDLTGQPGANFFRPLDATSTAQASNTGTASVTAVIGEVSARLAGEVHPQFDGAQWTLTNLSTGAAQSGGGPFIVDGMEISLSGAAAAGDGFTIQPTARNAARFDLALSDPRSIAAASLLRAGSDGANSGTATI